MKKVFIKAYLKKNLGDDLFLKILSERYKEKFYCICSPKYKYFKIFQNIKFNHSYINYYAFRIFERIIKKYNVLEERVLSKSDIMINIGGSIFMETQNWEEEYRLYETSKPYYVIGANFGPYKTEEYKKFVERLILKRAVDVCMRDSMSYKSFKLSNIRYAPDIVFSLNLKDIIIKNNKKVIISVMDFRNRFDKSIVEIYEQKIIELIELLYNKKYEIVLMSFCKGEGDEKEINNILSKIDNIKLKSMLKVYNYRGNIKEALNIIGDCRLVIGSRFHANVLGLLMNKTIIPICYNDKTINLLKDINFGGKFMEMEKLNEFDVNAINNDDLEYKIDITFQKDLSKMHFREIDKILSQNSERKRNE